MLHPPPSTVPTNETCLPLIYYRREVFPTFVRSIITKRVMYCISLLPSTSQPSLMNLRTYRWEWYVVSPPGTPDLHRLTHFRARQFLACSAIVLSHTVVWHHQHFCFVFITLKLIYILMLSVCLIGVSLVLVANKKF